MKDRRANRKGEAEEKERDWNVRSKEQPKVRYNPINSKSLYSQTLLCSNGGRVIFPSNQFPSEELVCGDDLGYYQSE
jgi:hypothetical protein